MGQQRIGRRLAIGMWLFLLSLSSGSCGGGEGTPTAVSATPSAPTRTEAEIRADRAAAVSALAGRTIAGYQAWFGCPGEPGVTGAAARWRHWFAGQVPEASQLTVDMLPEVSGLPSSALCATRMTGGDGSTVQLFTSADPAVIDLHFGWMKEHGIDGVAVQRFVNMLAHRSERERGDIILRAIRAAAERHGRLFYIAYDVSGADPATLYDAIRDDWTHLVQDLGITSSPAYLSGAGRPLLQLWGFGFRDRPGEPAPVRSLLADLRRGGAAQPVADSPSRSAVLLIGGVPAGWRNADIDSRGGATWASLYREFDVVSPWTVGRYESGPDNLGFVEGVVRDDIAEANRLGLGYMPVIFPGFSWANLMTARGNPAQAIPNKIPRRCGHFLWQQGQTRIAAGARTLFIAMFDEVDEATAIMPVVAKRDALPAGTGLIALDQDGCDLPADWYLRVSGSLAGYLRAGEVPPESLSQVMRP